MISNDEKLLYLLFGTLTMFGLLSYRNCLERIDDHHRRINALENNQLIRWMDAGREDDGGIIHPVLDCTVDKCPDFTYSNKN